MSHDHTPIVNISKYLLDIMLAKNMLIKIDNVYKLNKI